MSSWSVKATNNTGGGNSELPTADNHPAVLVGMVDLGWREEEYDGRHYEARKVALAWEVAGETRSDGQPFILMRDFTFAATFGKRSKLRELIEGWRGRPFDDDEGFELVSLLGKPCNLNVGHKTSQKGSTYATILGVSKLSKGMQPPRPTVSPFAWNCDDGLPFQPPEWLPYLYGRPLSEWVDEGMRRRPKGPVPATVPAGATADGDDDDSQIPF
jgi:hypothetical protein